MRHGNGLSVNRISGIIYRGEFREGEMQGHGILYCPPGEVIEANFSPGGKIQDGKIKILVGSLGLLICISIKTANIMKVTSRGRRETAAGFTISRTATYMRVNS
jgi:hypothetical protein